MTFAAAASKKAVSAPGAPDAAADTFPKMLLVHARQRPDRPAMREKDHGIWQSWTWAQVAAEVEALAGGLKSLGFRRGDKLAIIGDNRPRLYWAIAASQALGGIPVPLYQDAIADEMAYVLENAEVALRHRRGPGAGRQAAGDQGRAVRFSKPSSFRRSARPAPLHAALAAFL